MKAFTKRSYGGPEILQLEEVPKPEPKHNEILVRVHANSANPADWHFLRGAPFFARFSTGLFKPSNPILGADFAGVVESVGKEVSAILPGDRVYGESLAGGAFAEYIAISEDSCGKMTPGQSFVEMASVPIAGITALQALLTHGKMQRGERVLINGASGGVGHFAVQIAKVHGADVTAVCSSRHRDFVNSLGADHVLAYDKTDIHQHEERYDLILDIHGNLRFRDFKRLGRRGVLVGFTTLGNMMGVLLRNAFSKFHLTLFTAKINTEDLDKLNNLFVNGQLRVHIDRTYPYTQIPEAIRYIEKMHTTGKVAMEWVGES